MLMNDIQVGFNFIENEDIMIKPYISADDVYMADTPVCMKIYNLEKKVKLIERKQRKMAWQKRR